MTQNPHLFLAFCLPSDNGTNALNQNAFGLIERAPVVSPVVKTRGAGGLVVGHLLGHLELSAVTQVLRDPGRPEAVARDLRAYAGGLGPAGDHSVYVLLGHGKA